MNTATPTPVFLLAGALLASAVSGCTTYYGEARTRQATAEHEDMMLLREDLRQLSGRLETLEMEYNQLLQDVEHAGHDASRTAAEEAAALRADLSDLARRISDLEASRQRDKDEMLDKVSETVAKLMKKSVAPARQPKRAVSDYGYEHTVEAGQTLSEIAKVYGVSTAAIIDANNLQNPDQLKVGQTLFIPE